LDSKKDRVNAVSAHWYINIMIGGRSFFVNRSEKLMAERV